MKDKKRIVFCITGVLRYDNINNKVNQSYIDDITVFRFRVDAEKYLEEIYYKFLKTNNSSNIEYLICMISIDAASMSKSNELKYSVTNYSRLKDSIDIDFHCEGNNIDTNGHINIRIHESYESEVIPESPDMLFTPKDDSVQLPIGNTTHGYRFVCTEDVSIKAGNTFIFDTGIKITIPKGWFGILEPNSAFEKQDVIVSGYVMPSDTDTFKISFVNKSKESGEKIVIDKNFDVGVLSILQDRDIDLIKDDESEELEECLSIEEDKFVVEAKETM